MTKHVSQLVRKKIGWIVLALLLIGGGILIGRMQSADVEPTVQRTVVTTIQQEAGAAFYVTGTLDLTATETVRRTETAFPTLMRVLRTAQPSWPIFGQGTVTVTVRVPGRVSYGFVVDDLEANDIRVGDEGVVEVRLPPLQVYAVEPDLAELAVKTETSSWLWVDKEHIDATEQSALTGVQRALRQQAEAHLRDATQPRVNTAQALEKVLRPSLQAAGIDAPRFRIRIGPQLVLEPAG